MCTSDQVKVIILTSRMHNSLMIVLQEHIASIQRDPAPLLWVPLLISVSIPAYLITITQAYEDIAYKAASKYKFSKNFLNSRIFTKFVFLSSEFRHMSLRWLTVIIRKTHKISVNQHLDENVDTRFV